MNIIISRCCWSISDNRALNLSSKEPLKEAPEIKPAKSKERTLRFFKLSGTSLFTIL